MRNKKLLAMSLVVALTFTACGKSSKNESVATPTPVVETEDTATEEPTVEVEEVVEEEITEEAPEAAGELVSDETLDSIHTAVVEEMGEDYIANVPFDATLVEEIFGVNADWYDAAIAEGPMMSVHVDKFLAFHATEGNLENIEAALNAYRESQIEGALQYPMNLNKVQGCVVETVGDYAFLVMVGFIDEMAYETEDEMIEAHKAINESVIEIAKGIIE